MVSNEVVVDDVVVSGVVSVMDNSCETTWKGSMSELGVFLNHSLRSNEVVRELPRSPSALRVALNRVVDRLRSRGIGVQFGRNHEQRFVQFTSSRN